jgi:hypothetical protein
MNSLAAASSARRSHRHIHDPGARTILELVLGQRKHLKQHAKQIAQATHAQPGGKPAPGAPLPDLQGLLVGLRSLRGDLVSLHHSITRVRCHTAAGRHGKALIRETLLTLDSSLRTFATAVQTPDRVTRASLVQQAQDLNRQAKRTVKTALASLQR